MTICVGRDWTTIAPPGSGLPGIEARFTGIGGTGEDAWVNIELRQGPDAPAAVK